MRHDGPLQRAIALGAKDYLAKPFNDQLLLRRVRRLLLRPTAVPPPSGEELFL